LRNPVAHPLDPLTGDEFTAVASVLQREHGVGDGWRFASVELAEPGKSELHACDEGGPPPPRRAELVSFWLKPFGFFDRNPALDVVATPPDMCLTPSTSAHH
jgi:Cu2+-containing amine oxidase